MRYHERLRIDAELLAELSQPEVVMLTRKIIEAKKIDILKYNPATSQYETIEKGFWGHGGFELEMNKLLLTKDETLKLPKVDRDSRYCGVLTDEDSRIFYGYAGDRAKYALRFVDTYGIIGKAGKEHNIALDEVLQMAFKIESGKRKLDGASMSEILDYFNKLDEHGVKYWEKKDFLTFILLTQLGIAIEHVCKDGSNRYGTTVLGTTHFQDYFNNAKFIGKYNPLITETQNRILKAYLKGNYAITEQTKKSGEFSKKEAIQHMSEAENFIKIEAPKLFSLSESVIRSHINSIQRAYGWNPVEQSWIRPVLDTTNPAEFVADTQGYWYYYENAYNPNLHLYDIVKHIVLPTLIENKMLNYLMIGSNAPYQNIFVNVHGVPTPQQVLATFFSEHGTTFVWGDENNEYDP